MMLTSDIFLPPGKFAATGPTVYVGRLRDYCFCARPLMGGKSQNRRVICWPLAYKRAWGGVQEILFGLLLLLLLLLLVLSLSRVDCWPGSGSDSEEGVVRLFSSLEIGGCIDSIDVDSNFAPRYM